MIVWRKEAIYKIILLMAAMEAVMGIVALQTFLLDWLIQEENG